MTTQAEVINAFINHEEGPWRASNMKVVHDDDRPRDYLLGGQGGLDVLLAYREPIRRVIYFNARYYSYASRMHPTDIRNQQRRVIRVCSGHDGDEVSIERAEEQPRPTASVPALREILPDYCIEYQEDRTDINTQRL